MNTTHTTLGMGGAILAEAAARRAQEMSRQAEADALADSTLLTARAERFLAIAASRAVPLHGEALVRDLFDLVTELSTRLDQCRQVDRGEILNLFDLVTQLSTRLDQCLQAAAETRTKETT